MRVILTTFILGLCVLGAMPNTVLAQVNLNDQINDQLNAGARGAQINDEETPVQEIVANTIKVILGLVGMYFMILTILGGYKYVNAKGDQGEVDAGQKMIKGAIIGLIVVLSAYSITLFVGSKFRQTVVVGGEIERGAELNPDGDN